MTRKLPYFTLTAPGGHIIARDENRRVVEDRFARIIQDDGFPIGTTAYVMRRHWIADGRFGAEGAELSTTILGCDDTGWYQLDGSKVPATASPARFNDAAGLAVGDTVQHVDSLPMGVVDCLGKITRFSDGVNGGTLVSVKWDSGVTERVPPAELHKPRPTDEAVTGGKYPVLSMGSGS